MHPKSTWLTNLFGMFKKKRLLFEQTDKTLWYTNRRSCKATSSKQTYFFFVCEVSLVKTAYLRMHKGVDATKLSCFFFFEHTQQKETG